MRRENPEATLLFFRLGRWAAGSRHPFAVERVERRGVRPASTASPVSGTPPTGAQALVLIIASVLGAAVPGNHLIWLKNCSAEVTTFAITNHPR